MALREPNRTYRQVIDACQAERANRKIVTGTGQCLGTVRQLLRLPTTGLYDAKEGYYETKAAGGIHKTGVAPVGTPVWWLGGSSGHGHVAISAGNGYCYSTDLPRSAHLNRIPITRVRHDWGQTYMGWSSTYGNSYRISYPHMAAKPSVSLRKITNAQKVEQDAPRTTRTYPAGSLLTERALARLGCSPGPVDGHLGTGYTDAVKKFQKGLGDRADGVLGPKQFSKLAKSSGLFTAVA